MYCILDISSLTDMGFANIFCKSVACLFIPLTLGFEEKKVLILMISNLSFFSGMNHTFDIISKMS